METVLSFCIIRPTYAPNNTTLLPALDVLNEHRFLNHNRCLDRTATSPISLLFTAVYNVPWRHLHETQQQENPTFSINTSRGVRQ